MPRIIDRIQKAMKDPNRKSLLRMASQYSRFKLFYPELAEQYFNKYLYNKFISNTEDYIITMAKMKKLWALNDADFIPLLRNKLSSEWFFSSHNIPIIRSIAWNANHFFFRDDGSLQKPDVFLSISDFKNLLMHLKDTGLWKTESLIVKKAEDSSQGKDIFRIQQSDMGLSEAELSAAFKTVIGSRYLFQNFIEQHSALNVINPNAVNTLRIDSYTDASGEIHIYNAALRMSAGKAYLDSAPTGGLQIGLDLYSGQLLNEAFGDFENGFAHMYSHHPLTHVPFKGYQIPFFSQALDLVRKAAALLPQIKVVGWDVAVTPQGPILVEGNNFPGIAFSEISQKGFKNNATVKKMLAEANAL